MMIYGLSLLSFCVLAGTFVGSFLGNISQIEADLGGVGFSMLFLVIAVDYLDKRDMLPEKAKDGIRFWRALFIPVVIAMLARQNVIAVKTSGLCAVLAGFLAVLIAFAFVPLLSKIPRQSSSPDKDIKEGK